MSEIFASLIDRVKGFRGKSSKKVEEDVTIDHTSQSHDICIVPVNPHMSQPFFRGKHLVLLPETDFDDVPLVPVEEKDVVYVTLEEALDPSVELGRKMVDSFKANGFFVLDLKNEDGANMFEEAYKEVEKFFSQESKEKFKFAYPHELAGYSNIEFENQDNRRVPENRDVFAIRPHLEDKLEWPSEELREKSLRCYNFLFEVTCRLLSSLAQGLEQSPSIFLDLVGQESVESRGNFKLGEKEIELTTDPKLNKSTNMCMFRYHDPINEVKEPQKCMIHQDRGLITLLPKASYPGLEVLHPHTRTFSPVESFTKPGQVIVFPGLCVEFMTQGFVPATMHRVVRSPNVIRFSMPFEVKPEEQRQLAVFSNGAGLEEYLKQGVLYKNPILPGNPPKHTARCDGCVSYIGGVRQKCSECDDYDLCDECYLKRDSIHPNHKFHEVEARQLLSQKPVEVLDFMRLAADMSRLNKTWKFQQQTKLSFAEEERRKAEKAKE